ncbi:PEP-CTERM protein-sorting domain-containing protein [Rubritalea squalenifaciens DSM 18772]|uniref:PEP-CTERM protein-sorting domain-containing protein n=1 Tax=Rubritalea squalenifaciens DSM 18772 TaxID=1123071 RepID=A0A1M6M3W4_9BACT|nr:PEP-CTERM sorting domain-containing protein [Rubritalea squalenifaciens]SHJ78107.1 PEP-CTERM protein-sorting domain-containing protein [Rubritalea squalenifaciens DSM 18772]
MKNTLLTSITLLTATLSSQAATLVHFVDGTDADDLALTTNNAPVSADYSVSNLTANGFQTGSVITRTEFGAGNDIPGATGEWLFQRGAYTGGSANSDSDYYGFTVTNNSGTGLNLDAFSFDAISVTNDANQFIIAEFQLYYQIDGGGFSTIGSTFAAESPTGVTANVSEFSPKITPSIDLSGIGAVADGSTIEFRLSVHDNSGSQAKASFIQNIELTAVPEPSSTALIGLSGLSFLLRRRR